MENLGKYGIMELSTKQMKETNGGLIGLLFLSALVVAGPMLGWANGKKAIGQP